MFLKAPDFWQQPKSWQVDCLKPLATVWDLGAGVHRLLSDPKKLPVPVISVGNWTMGGAGKTPLVAWLASHLKESSIISRGYKGQVHKKPLRVDVAHHQACNVGDEPLLLSRRAPTWIGPCRYQTAVTALAKGAGILIMDDGHQNHQLVKDLSLVVIDGRLGLGNGQIFPAGPLRESMKTALKHTDAVIIVGTDCRGIKALLPNDLPVFQAVLETTFERPKNAKPIAAFAGIAYPQKFLHTLKDLGIIPYPFLTYPDHYQFQPKDLKVLSNLVQDQTVLTTEKDWVRLPKDLQQQVLFVPVDLRFEEHQSFLSFVKDHLG